MNVSDSIQFVIMICAVAGLFYPIVKSKSPPTAPKCSGYFFNNYCLEGLPSSVAPFLYNKISNRIFQLQDTEQQ